MRDCSHITNVRASAYVRTKVADTKSTGSYKPNMARRGIPKGPVRWYLREWMATVPDYAKRGGQAAMAKAAGWSKATMSQLYNGDQDYSPAILEAAAVALHAEPYELLLPPERAMAIRALRESAVTIVKTEPAPATPANDKTGTNG